jgi:polyadenylate-binding protein
MVFPPDGWFEAVSQESETTSNNNFEDPGPSVEASAPTAANQDSPVEASVLVPSPTPHQNGPPPQQPSPRGERSREPSHRISHDTPNPVTLAQHDPAERREVLGEALYPLVYEQEQNMAGENAYMLLELDSTEVLHLYSQSLYF